jgi:hypothetical protein
VTTDVVVLPLSWRSYARAGFFAGMLIVFGGAALVGSSGVVRWIGLVLFVIGLMAAIDFALYTPRWRLAADRLHVPRLWSPSRALGLSPKWHPEMTDLGRRDSMFVAASDDGAEHVTPNLMVARSDVKQWLYLIGEARAASS